MSILKRKQKGNAVNKRQMDPVAMTRISEGWRKKQRKRKLGVVKQYKGVI